MFSKFLAKYSDEMRLIGTALERLQFATALPPQDRAQVAETVEAVKQAAENVANAVDKIKGTAKDIDPNADAITQAVNAIVPTLVAEAVAKALAKVQEPKRVRTRKR